MKKLSIKKIIATSLLTIAMTTLLSGCGQKYDKTLNVFNWTEYIPKDVITEFEKEYGIKVNYTTYSSNEEMLAKIQSAPAGTYDLAVASDYMVTIMNNKGLIEDIGTDKITNLNNIDSSYLNLDFDKGNKVSVPYMIPAGVIAVNTDMTDLDIKSYKDLLDPSLKDSIVVLDDERALIGIALKSLGYSMNEVDEAKLQEAKEFLIELKPNIKAFDSDSPKIAMISGETAVGYMWNAECALAMGEKPSIKVVYPEEGMYKTIDCFVIPTGAKNKEEAQQFIDFILRPEISKIISEEYPYKNPNKAAESVLPEIYLNNPASNIPNSELEKGEFIKDVGEYTGNFDKIWSEFKK